MIQSVSALTNKVKELMEKENHRFLEDVNEKNNIIKKLDYELLKFNSLLNESFENDSM